MARKKAASRSSTKKRTKRPELTDEQKTAKKRLRKCKQSKLRVYEVPDQAKLDAYESWAIVTQNPERVRERKALNQDPDSRWWLPVTWRSCTWPDVYWLGVVSVKLAGRVWPRLCRPCNLKLMCAAEGRGIDPKHECVATRETLVDIVRRPRPQVTITLRSEVS